MTTLLSAPWWLLLTLAFVGAIVAWSGLQKQQAGPRNVGLAIIGLAVLLFGLGFLVESDLDKVKRLNGELVQSVPKQDWVKMTSLLDADATLGAVGSTAFPNRTALVNGAKADVDHWGLKSVAVTHTDLKQDESGITVDINVLSQQDATSNFGFDRVTSSWRMVWDRDDAKQWHCHQITCIAIGSDTSAGVGQYLKAR